MTNENNQNFDIIFKKLEEAKQDQCNWSVSFPEIREMSSEIDVLRQLSQDVAETPIVESLTRG